MRKHNMLDVALLAAASMGMSTHILNRGHSAIIVDDTARDFDEEKEWDKRYPKTHPQHHLKYIKQVKDEAQAKRERKAAKRAVKII